MDDSKIVDLYLNRNESAIVYTSEKYGKRLRSLSFYIIRDQHAAEECENDTYFEAWKTIPPHEPRTYLYMYLARITRHIALNFCRKRNALKRSAHISELSAEMEQCIHAPDDFECRISDSEFATIINAFLENLNSQKRNIFVRRYWYLDSISDIAKRYSITESNAKSVLFRCRRQLKKQLIKEGYRL